MVSANSGIIGIQHKTNGPNPVLKWSIKELRWMILLKNYLTEKIVKSVLKLTARGYLNIG